MSLNPVTPSYSLLTVMDIRCGPIRDHESNQQRLIRLAAMYGLADVDVKLIAAADDDLIDSYGRIAE